MRAALETVVWEFGFGLALLPGLDEALKPSSHACRTPQELRAYLVEIARLGWEACVPYDDRRPEFAFEEFDVGAVIDEELAAHRGALLLLKWQTDGSAPAVPGLCSLTDQIIPAVLGSPRPAGPGAG